MNTHFSQVNICRFFNRVASLFACLLLCACIQDADFEKFKVKPIDGWSYTSINLPDGQIDSASASEFKADNSGINVQATFQCTQGTRLQLLLSTFMGTGDQIAPIKLRFAHSAAFGKFQVADIKAMNHQINFSLIGHGDGDSNNVKIQLSPGETALKKKLSSPILVLTIPITTAPREITIKLDNPNIVKVFKDCDYKPAFMMTGLAN